MPDVETSLDDIDDAVLADRIAAGPSGAAHAEEAELYRRFAPRVRLYGLKHLGDEAAAQDLAQEVLLVTIEQLRAGKVRQTKQIGSFIFGASRMMATSIRRTTRRRQALQDQFAHLPAASPAPETACFDEMRLDECLRILAVRDRAVLILSFYAERTGPQIGAELGVSTGAVRVIRHRALERLRECVLRSANA
jgi:RNA polymerase sigma-70 factor (ECF subfamily)